MTAEQEKLVIENTGLVYTCYDRFVYKAKAIHFWREDIIQEGFVGLCTAAKTYDKSKGFAFSTYAMLLIQRGMFNLLRRIKNDKSYSSLDSPLKQNEDEELTLMDTIPYVDMVDDKLELEEIKQFLYDLVYCSGAESQKIMLLVLEGLTVPQIAKKMGKTKHQVSAQIQHCVTRVRLMYRYKNSMPGFPVPTMYNTKKEYLDDLKRFYWKKDKSKFKPNKTKS